MKPLRFISNFCFISSNFKTVTKDLVFLIFNSLTTAVPHHIETSQLICIANQLTGFYMMRNIGR